MTALITDDLLEINYFPKTGNIGIRTERSIKDIDEFGELVKTKSNFRTFVDRDDAVELAKFVSPEIVSMYQSVWDKLPPIAGEDNA